MKNAASMPALHGVTCRRPTVTVFWVLLLSAALFFQSRALRVSRENVLPVLSGYAPDAPPLIHLVKVSLGGFRGVAVSLLWFRVSQLQDQGRYVELVQLSDWITQLDPHAAGAWSYHAWNMAYNVSIMLLQPEDRLRWVRHGVELLRDRGLRFNPREARLYRELGWMFQHKIGSESDRAHRTYQMDLAVRLDPVLGPGGTAPDPESDLARRLKSKFRLSAERMHALQSRFGPLDWRLPESHAVYWAVRGIEQGDLREDLLLRRMVYQSLVASVRRGRLVDFDPQMSRWERAPHLELIPGTISFFEETLRLYPDLTLRLPFARFLVEAIRRSHAAGEIERRQAWIERLRDVMAPHPIPPLELILADDGERIADWFLGLDREDADESGPR